MNALGALAAVTTLAIGAGCGRSDRTSIAEVTQAASAAGVYAYTYAASGLASSVGTRETAYSIAPESDGWAVGTDHYALDALGRVAAISTQSLAYGPDGQIATATTGSRVVSYLYDETGTRIAKKTNGEWSAAYALEGYVTESALTETVTVAGHAVGLLRNGTFTALATDTRGTVQADVNGVPRVPSPYGARPVHPDIAAVVDYAGRGYDADLGANRMGVRDYDARAARFLQPDPLFLLEPERCMNSPSECNLYGYARSRPLDFVDPGGTEARLAAGVSDAYKTDYASAIAYLKTSETGAKLITAIEKDSHVIVIRPPSGQVEMKTGPFFQASPSDSWLGRLFGYQKREIVWDPHTSVKPSEGGVVSPALALAHEGDHALQQITNQKQFDRDVANTADPMFGNMEDRRVETGNENKIAKDLGEVQRVSHYGTLGTVACPTCTK